MKLAIHYTKENKAKEAIPEETYLISLSRQFVVVGVCQNMILHKLAFKPLGFKERSTCLQVFRGTERM